MKPGSYQGARTATALVQYVQNELGNDSSIDNVQQITTFLDVLDCSKNSLCMIGILPPMEDSSVKQRLEYQKTLNKVSSATVDKPISWLWASGKEQKELEEVLNIGTNYPVLVAVADKKKMYSTMVQAFSYDNIVAFVDDILRGKVAVSPIQSLPQIVRVNAWSADGIENKDEL